MEGGAAPLCPTAMDSAVSKGRPRSREEVHYKGTRLSLRFQTGKSEREDVFGLERSVPTHASGGI